MSSPCDVNEGFVAAFAPAQEGLGNDVSQVLVAAASGSHIVADHRIEVVAPRDTAKREVYVMGDCWHRTREF